MPNLGAYYAHERSYTLRQYVRSAELYGGYDSVFEEAARDLNPLDLAHRCIAMRGMAREYRSGSRTIRESFKLGSREREALVLALTEVRTGSIATCWGAPHSTSGKSRSAPRWGQRARKQGA
jgi:hypothetical protein